MFALIGGLKEKDQDKVQLEAARPKSHFTISLLENSFSHCSNLKRKADVCLGLEGVWAQWMQRGRYCTEDGIACGGLLCQAAFSWQVINGLKQRILKLEQQCKDKDSTIR